MNTSSLITFIMLIQVLSALTIIGLVLLQHGKGADMGAAFGSGASGSLFGATGSSNFLSKSTGVAAAIFFLATLTLAYLSSNRHPTVNGGVLDNLPVSSAPAATKPVVVAPAAAVSAASVAPTTASPQPAKTAPAAAGGPANQIPK